MHMHLHPRSPKLSAPAAAPNANQPLTTPPTAATVNRLQTLHTAPIAAATANRQPPHLRVRHRLARLRPHAVVSRHDDDGNVRDLLAAQSSVQFSSKATVSKHQPLCRQRLLTWTGMAAGHNVRDLAKGTTHSIDKWWITEHGDDGNVRRLAVERGNKTRVLLVALGVLLA